MLRYKYRDPRTSRQHGMGSDKAAAIKDARALNAAIYASMANSRVANIAHADKENARNLLIHNLNSGFTVV